MKTPDRCCQAARFGRASGKPDKELE